MKKKGRFICIICFIQFIISSLNVLSQDQFKIDSLSNELNTANDSYKIEIFKELAWEFRSANPIKALDYGQQALILADKLNDINQQASIYNYLGVIKRNQVEYSEALEYYHIANNLASKCNNKTEIAYSYNNIGEIYRIQNLDSLALLYYCKAISIFEQLNDHRGLAYSYYQVGYMYIEAGKYALALDYNLKALEMRKKLKNLSGIAANYRRIGDIYMYIKDYQKSLIYYNMALDINYEHNLNADLGNTYNRIGILYNTMKRHNKAIIYFDSALKISRKFNNSRMEDLALSELSYSYSALNNFKEAYKYLKLHKELSDSIFTEESNQQLQETQVKFETEKKEKEIILLNKEKEIGENKLLVQRTINIGIIIILLIVAIGAYLIYRSAKEKHHTNKLLSDINKLLNEKNEEIESQAEELKTTNEQLNELNATKDKFFSVIAHDLKNPFSSMIGFVNLLIDRYDEYDPKEIKETLQLLQNTSENAFKLLQNLLDWSRSQIGGIKFEPVSINLTKIVENNIELYHEIAKSKNIRLISEIENDTFVFADLEMINTVFRNLISNAIKFTTSGGNVKIKSINKNGYIEISVLDTGVGIDQENLQKMFRIDSKYSTVGTANEKGTGLGLILCKEFINQNDGEISVESELGKGTKFIFTLPAKNTQIKLIRTSK
ncbi:tetratricopeptide repeat protein [Bacteroidota bacterium]